MRHKIAASFLLVLVLFLPGSKAGLFNGLPLSAPEIVLTFFLFTALLSTDWNERKNIRRIILSVLTVLLVFQALSHRLLPFGWSVCLNSPASKHKLETICEPTAEFATGEKSYILPEINLDRNNFPLYFLNNLGYNYYKKNQPDRDSLPFNLEASAHIFSREKDNLRIKADGKIFAELNNHKYYFHNIFDNSYEIVLIPNQVNHVRIRYESFINKNNFLKIDAPKNVNYAPQTNFPVIFFSFAYKIIKLILLCTLSFGLGYALFLQFSALKKEEKITITILYASSVLFFILSQKNVWNFNRSILPFSIFLTFTSVYIALKRVPKKIIAFLILAVFINSCILTTSHIPPEKTNLLEGGNDELTHESFARSTFTANNLHNFLEAGEERLFYYQPLHRYIFGFFHKILGEPMWGPYLAQTVIFSLALIFFCRMLYFLAGKTALASFSILYFLALISQASSAFKFIQNPYQQALAFPLLIIGLSWMLFLLKKQKACMLCYFLLGLIWGAVFMIRTDWIPLSPGLLVFLFYKFYRTEFKIKFKTALASFFIGLAFFPFLIGLRNLIIAEKFVIMPTSGYVNLLPEIKTALGEKFNFYESSAIKFAREISDAYSGRYFELIRLLWNNLYEKIISTANLRIFLWIFAGLTTLASVVLVFKKKQIIPPVITLAILLFSFAPYTAINAFFVPHNRNAMLGIYDFFTISIIAVNIQIIFLEFSIFGLLKSLFFKLLFGFEISSIKKLSSLLKKTTTYSDMGLIDKLKVGYRPYICPFGKLLEYVPEKASVFDIGCGNGMFLFLASKIKNSEMLGGIEVSKRLIKNARSTLKNSHTPIFLEFFDGKIIPDLINQYKYIFLIDVLHHLPRAEQKNFLQKIYNKMSAGSFLIVKDIDAGRPILCLFNKLHDYIISEDSAGNELSCKKLEKYLRESGFIIQEVEKKRMWFYPHCTLLCAK